LDYVYGILWRTHRLGVVEFTRIDAGTQMLWRNPSGFKVKSGEYVYIKLPWLNEGGKEWHPFSVYLCEATAEGLNEVHQCHHDHIDIEMKFDETLPEFTQRVLAADFVPIQDHTSLLVNEARQDFKKFDTTQVFISPVGDWSKGLLEQVQGRRQLRSCWVSGPFTNPYFIAHDFSHLVLTASGIGITPVLATLGQYPGFSRTKIFIWLTRSKSMLQFFAPLLKDAHLSVVFYTNKDDPLTKAEEIKIRSHGNIFVENERPKNLTSTIDLLITMFENGMNEPPSAQNLSDIDVLHRKSWCVLYCGGAKAIRNDLHGFAEKKGLGWECESFNW
jgi:hypothetical protein